MLVINIYLILALLISGSMVVMNSKSLENRTPFKLLLLFASTPIMAVIVLIEMIKERK